MENQLQHKPRILCLHGFRTSAEIPKKLVGKWPETVLECLDLVFLDAPFPARGISDVEGIFDPPYYEWFLSNQVKSFSRENLILVSICLKLKLFGHRISRNALSLKNALLT